MILASALRGDCVELELKDIVKLYASGPVLDHVDFDVRGGEICALLGENGAGKSTLMKIAGGLLAPDSGEILIDGKRVRFSSPADSLRAGIAFIHQELNLIDDLTVYENLFLPDFRKSGPFLDRESMISEAKALFERLNIGLDPCAEVSGLDASYKQMVEIAKAFRSDASVIIMDEPTSSLSDAEIDRVFGIMRTLREKGIGIIFISHKLGEVMEICDRYLVLRNGVAVSRGRIGDVTAEKLASFMVGHSLTDAQNGRTGDFGDEVLRVEHLSDGAHFRDFSMTLRRGEILGVTGLLGDGRSEIFETVAGVRGRKHAGSVFLSGKRISPSGAHEAMRSGIAFLAKNRLQSAVFPDMTILDNGTIATLKRFCRYGLLKEREQSSAFAEQAESLDIRMGSPGDSVQWLSGGNQQKVMLAKWLLSDPKVLILDNPTQGVDVGAKEDIYRIVRRLADGGMGVVILSPEAKEIIRLCDSAIVLCRGEIAGTVSGEKMNEQTMLYLASGAKIER